MSSNLTETTPLTGWRRTSPPSLPESNGSVPIKKGLGFWRKILSYAVVIAALNVWLLTQIFRGWLMP
ncbi:MAG: hypothetical protein LH472_15535 [Pyrinomonadaceae bacterium]|nr:hypothetical protein [Pyrinomonadaceae bacterium]